MTITHADRAVTMTKPRYRETPWSLVKEVITFGWRGQSKAGSEEHEFSNGGSSGTRPVRKTRRGYDPALAGGGSTSTYKRGTLPRYHRASADGGSTSP